MDELNKTKECPKSKSHLKTKLKNLISIKFYLKQYKKIKFILFMRRIEYTTIQLYTMIYKNNSIDTLIYT